MFFSAFRTACLAITLAVFGAVPLHASSPLVAVDLAEIDHDDALLTLVSPDGRETILDLDGVERLPTYRLETTTPWRDVPAVFEGVQLKDLLAEAGLDQVAEILVTAENDYTSVVPRSVWESVPFLVATRVNGGPIPRRARGPVLFVIEAGAYAASDIAKEEHLVWMASRIEQNR